MPDDRLFHICIGHSDKVNALTDFERGVWWMYKLAADDFGVMRYSAIPLQNAATWLERRPARMVLKALQAIEQTGLIHSFTHQSTVYCYQRTWQTWQKITYPRATAQPAPPPDELARCGIHTQWLFRHHPKGGRLPSWQHPDTLEKHSRKAPEVLPDDSGNPPEVFPPLVSVSDGVGVSKSVSAVKGGHRNHAFCGSHFCVSHRQHEVLSKELGSARERIDLLALYPNWDASDDPIDNLLPWLKARIQRETDRLFAERIEQTKNDWYEECGRVHHHECGLSSDTHRTRMLLEAEKAASA